MMECHRPPRHPGATPRGGLRRPTISHFLFITWPGGGNVPPAIALAQEVRRRGHAVTFAGYPPQEAPLTARGFPFVTLSRSQEAMAAAAPGLPKLVEGVLLCTPQLTELPDVFARTGADALVIDCMLFAALTAAQRDRLPTLALVHSPPGALLAPDRGFGAVVPSPLSALRAVAGLEPITRLWELWSELPAVCCSIPELDPHRDKIPAECVYVGPTPEGAPPSGVQLPWREQDARPLVLISFSTERTFSQRSRIERTLAALADAPYRVLVTSSNAEVDGLAVPANAMLVRYVPHGEILPRVTVTVTHGGHGTLIASLAHGIPVVCLPNPLIADQTPLALQVERLGAGRALDGEEATPGEILVAVQEILTDPSYRAAAGRLADIIRHTPGAADAADRLSGLTGDPPRAEC